MNNLIQSNKHVKFPIDGSHRTEKQAAVVYQERSFVRKLFRTDEALYRGWTRSSLSVLQMVDVCVPRSQCEGWRDEKKLKEQELGPDQKIEAD